MQNYEQLYFYIHEYQRLIYDYYSKHSIAFLTTYFNINPEETIWDDEKVMGGYYEKVGELSGIKWNKYVLLPVFFVSEVTTIFDGIETGLIKNNECEIIIPSSYGIQPYFNDLIKFEQDYLRNINPDIYPIMAVTGIEKSTNSDRTFYKLKLKTEQSITMTQVENQLSNTFVFYNYTKNIYDLNTAIFLTKLMQKSEEIKKLLDNIYDNNSGFYFV